MALPAGFPEQEWKYYDFRANWDEFLRCWKSDAVQDELEYDIQDWCENHAFLMPDGSNPAWKRGAPLWRLSRTDYWHQKNNAAAEEYVERNGCLAKFKRTMEQQGRVFRDRHTAWEAFYEICWDQIIKDVEPKPDTLESMILVMGGGFLYNALSTAARRMFPVEDVIYAKGGMVLLPEQKLVFDFMTYYYDVVDSGGKPVLQSDAEYDSRVEYYKDLDARRRATEAAGALA
jgi:hypothetical protein